MCRSMAEWSPKQGQGRGSMSTSCSVMGEGRQGVKRGWWDGEATEDKQGGYHFTPCLGVPKGIDLPIAEERKLV